MHAAVGSVAPLSADSTNSDVLPGSFETRQQLSTRACQRTVPAACFPQAQWYGVLVKLHQYFMEFPRLSQAFRGLHRYYARPFHLR